MNLEQIIAELNEKSMPAKLAGMKRYGIDIQNALGITMPELRKLAKTIKRDHVLAQSLWDTGLHEARILASLIDEPKLVNPEQIDAWVKDFNSWDVCDQVCGNLFCFTPFAPEKAIEFCGQGDEFTKRAGFVLMAQLAVHHKKADDSFFMALLPYTEREAWDERNFVKKAVNWAIRQIGKRNPVLRSAAMETAKRILHQNTKAAKWIATDALKELISKVE